MKTILYILTLVFIVSCKNDMKAESAEMVETSDAIDLEISSNSVEQLPIQKFNEYVELIQLKQQHPEFANDINAQLLSFTKDSASIFNYENGFTISNIEPVVKSKTESDSVEIFTLKFTVTTNSKVFQDSILTHVTSESDYLQTVETVTIKKVRFSKFEK